MNRIQDKKRWWVANFCRPTVAPRELPMPGLAMGLGMVGLALAIMGLLAFVPELSNAVSLVGAHGVSLAIIFAVPAANERRSVALKRQRAEIAAAAAAILDKAVDEKNTSRNLTADEQKAYDLHIADIEALDVAIPKAEKVEAAMADRPTVDSTASRPNQTVTTTRDLPSNIEIVARYGKPRLFKGENAAQDAYKAGMWVLGYVFNREDAREWCKNQGLASVWVDKNFTPILNVSREGGNSDGGYLVPTVLENMIIDLREQYGVLRQLAQVHPMASDAVNLPRRSGGLTAYPVGESTAATLSTKAWNSVGLTARKWMVLTKYTTELAEDAIISVAEDLAQEVAYAFAYAEDNAGFNGDGSSSYASIVGIKIRFDNQVSGGASTLAGALDAASGHDTFAEIDNTDLTNLMAKLPKYASAAAGWVVSQPGFSAVFQRLAAAAGGNTRQSMSNEKQVLSYLGYPITITQSMPTSTGDLSDKCMILFGDFRSAVLLGTRRGISIAVSKDVYFTTDEIGIRGTERFDINVHDIGDTSNAGPIVALIGE